MEVDMENGRDIIELLVGVVGVLGWMAIGFFTGLVRWYWVEGAKRISVNVAAQEAEAATEDAALNGVVVLSDFAETYYRIAMREARTNFFLASVATGPIGTIIFLAGWIRYAIMHRKIRG
jgi:hypothetical protein